MGDWKIFTGGDPCFAKVKGYIPYPGRVLGRVENVKKPKLTVKFYGTNEVNDVAVENVWHVTFQNVKKMVTEKSLQRKFFKPAWEEMKEQHIEVMKIEEDRDDERDKAADMTKEGSNQSDEMTIPGDSVPDESDEEFSLDFNYLTNKKQDMGKKVMAEKKKEVPAEQVVVPLGKESLDLVDSFEGEMDTFEVEDVGEEHSNGKEKSWDCHDCGAIIVGEKGFIDHLFDHALEEKAASVEGSKAAKPKSKKTGTIPDKSTTRNVNNAKPEDSTSPEISKKKTAKPSKSKTRGLNKKPVRAKKSKTLRESEIETNDAFVDKIVTKQDGTFHCKNCPMFVTSVRLLARSHAQSCRIKKKMGRRRLRKSHCDECGEDFEGKMRLVRHIKESHLLPSYQCSICMRKFKSRLTYRRHLKVHSLKTVICPHCPKRFSFESYKNRHVAKAHLKQLKIVKSNVSKERGDEEVVIEINQKEEKNGENFFWEFEVSFPNTEKSNSSSYSMFHNSLGLYSKEDWDDWMLSSKMLNMSIRADGSNDGFEVALLQQPSGGDKVMCVGNTISFWNKIWTAEDFVEEIIDELVDTAVAVTGGESDPDTSENVVVDSKGGGSIEKALADQNILLPKSAQRSDENGGEALNLNSDVGEEAFVGNSDQVGKPENPHLIQCNQCGSSGFRNMWFLRRHISLMHAGGVQCDICGHVFIDKYHYIQHSKTCYFWCSKVGCYFHEKRRSRIDSHERRHDRET